MAGAGLTQSIYASDGGRRWWSCRAVCDMVLHLPGQVDMQSRQRGSTLSFPGREDARRRQLPTSRKLVTTRKTRGTTTTMRRRRISVLLTIDDDRTPSPRWTEQVLPPGRWKLIDYVSVHALRSQPSCFIATSVMSIRTRTGAGFVPVIQMSPMWVRRPIAYQFHYQ